jgi:hypothetical protein
MQIGAGNELDWRGCITHWLVSQHKYLSEMYINRFSFR